MKTNAADGMNLIYRVETGNTDSKSLKRQTIKIFVFLIVDLLVFVVTVGSFIKMHDTWDDCVNNFDGWVLAIMIVIGLSLLLGLLQEYARR